MIDSHCHLDFDAFQHNRALLLQQCAVDGISAIVVPGVAPEQWPRLLQLVSAKQPLALWAGLGLHPWWVATASLSPQQLASRLAAELQHPRCVAVGECGLDGSIECPLPTQRVYLEVQLQLACDCNLPLIVHAHKAHNEVLQLLQRYRPPAGGVIHGFAGSAELAQQYWRLGFYLGVGGTISYPRARKTRAAVVALPLQSLLLETDAPDMPLCGMQGQANNPLQLLKVADHLAVLRNVSLAEVVEATLDNTRRLFRLPGLRDTGCAAK